MLTRSAGFVDQAECRYDEQQHWRGITGLKRRPAAMGFEFNSLSAAAKLSRYCFLKG